MVRWTGPECIGWINEGQLELVGIHPDAKVRTTTQTLVAGARQSLPSDALKISRLQCNASGAVVTACDRATLDAYAPNWMVSPTGQTVTNFIEDGDPGVFYVWPAQGAVPATVVITYTAYPNQVAEGGNLDVRDIYATKILNYVLYRAFSKDAEFGGNAERATAYYTLFKG